MVQTKDIFGKRVKLIGEFIDMWEKFREIYKAVFSCREITSQEESLFENTVNVLSSRIDGIKEEFRFDFERNADISLAFKNVLEIRSLKNVSDSMIERLDFNWQAIYVFLKEKKVSLEAEAEGVAKKKGNIAKVVSEVFG